MAPTRKYITSSLLLASTFARKLFSKVAFAPAALIALSIWLVSGKRNSYFPILLKTPLTSTYVFVLEVPEHPQCDCAAHKSNNEDTNDGIDNEAGKKAEEEGDDEGEDEGHDAHLSDLGPAVLQISHQLLKKALCPTAAEQSPNNVGLVRNGIGYTSGEEIFAGK